LDARPCAPIFSFFGFVKRFGSTYLLVELEAPNARRLEDAERNVVVYLGVGDGAQDFLAGLIERSLRFLAFDGIVQNGAHPLRSQLQDGRATARNRLAPTKMLEERIANQALDGEAGPKGEVGERRTDAGEEAVGDDPKNPVCLFQGLIVFVPKRCLGVFERNARNGL